jgi:hypothetical protein
MSDTWINAEGIRVSFGSRYSDDAHYLNRLRALNSMGPLKYLEMDVDLAKVAAGATGYPEDLDNDGTADGFTDHDAYIPAQAQITRCMFISTEAAADGTSVNIGTYQKDGTVIDADGLFAALLTAEAGLGEISYGDGADVEASGIGVTRASSNLDAYVAIENTGTFTAGKGRLIIEYLDGIADA